jgi:hypothetical protein
LGRLDNHLVPKTISRHFGAGARQAIFYDLNSTSGTRVNGKRVQEWVLKPGDVITLATVQLIYGEDPSGPPPVTSPYTPPFTRDVDRDGIAGSHHDRAAEEDRQTQGRIGLRVGVKTAQPA